VIWRSWSTTKLLAETFFLASVISFRCCLFCRCANSNWSHFGFGPFGLYCTIIYTFDQNWTRRALYILPKPI
jgi:hypothetical protein